MIGSQCGRLVRVSNLGDLGSNPHMQFDGALETVTFSQPREKRALSSSLSFLEMGRFENALDRQVFN